MVEAEVPEDAKQLGGGASGVRGRVRVEREREEGSTGLDEARLAEFSSQVL